MLHAVIMAGGSGTRFWPASRHARPKQLLELLSGRTMLEETVARLGELVPTERVVVATNRDQAEQIAALLPDLPAESILIEPCKRDTAAAIGLAALHVARRDPEATMLVMPSDHVIQPTELFQQALRQASELVAREPELLVTFGIRPTYPAETFGYIERGVALDLLTQRGASAPSDVFRVQRFCEKPRADVAHEFLAAGRFYWNAGIFVWRAATILDALRRFQPALFERLQAIEAAHGSQQQQEVLEREFAAIEGRSIDYAVMEQAEQVAVIEAPFEWDDLGSWRAFARWQGEDDDGNTICALHVGIDTTGSIVRGEPGHLIATLGVKDCLIVHTPDATLVANKHDEESIRKLVQWIEQRGWQEYL